MTQSQLGCDGIAQQPVFEIVQPDFIGQRTDVQFGFDIDENRHLLQGARDIDQVLAQGIDALQVARTMSGTVRQFFYQFRDQPVERARDRGEVVGFFGKNAKNSGCWT